MALKYNIDSKVRMATEKIDENIQDASDSITDTLSSIQDVAAKSISLGFGLAALASENIESFVKDTVKYGEQVEKRQMRKLSQLRSEAIDRVKEMFGYGKQTYQRAGQMMEDTLDEMIEDLELPNKADINRIDRKLNEIRRSANTTAETLEKKRHARKATAKAALSTKRKGKTAGKKAHKTSSKTAVKSSAKAGTRTRSRATSK